MTWEAWLSSHLFCASLSGVFLVISADSYFGVLFLSFCSLPTKRSHVSDLATHAFGFSFIWTFWDSSEITGFVFLSHRLILCSSLLVFELELDQCWSRSQIKQSSLLNLAFKFYALHYSMLNCESIYKRPAQKFLDAGLHDFFLFLPVIEYNKHVIPSQTENGLLYSLSCLVKLL